MWCKMVERGGQISKNWRQMRIAHIHREDHHAFLLRLQLLLPLCMCLADREGQCIGGGVWWGKNCGGDGEGGGARWWEGTVEYMVCGDGKRGVDGVGWVAGPIANSVAPITICMHS